MGWHCNTKKALRGPQNVEGWLYDVLAKAELPASEHFGETINWRQNEAPVASKALYQSYVDWMRLHQYQGDVLLEEHFARNSGRSYRRRSAFRRAQGLNVFGLDVCRAYGTADKRLPIISDRRWSGCMTRKTT